MIIDSLKQNMCFQMTLVPSYLPDVKICKKGDMTLVSSSYRKDECFNFVISTAPHSQEEIKEALAFFPYDLEHFSWWVMENNMFSSELETSGLSLKETYVDLCLCAPVPSLSSSLSFEMVQTPEKQRDFAIVLGQVDWTEEATAYRQIPLSLYEENPAFKMVIGYEQDQPVVVGTLVFHADVAGIYYIATAPDKRHRGYASAMVSYLSQEAQKMHFSTIALQATEKNALFYTRLGFKPCGTHWEYGW